MGWLNYTREQVPFDRLQGKTITEINRGERDGRNEMITFHCSDGSIFDMYHDQDCCEGVDLEDVCGDFKDLLNTPILLAEESGDSGEEGEYGDHFTWTFYKLATIKGAVTLRWYGASNGYYSESVDLYERVPRVSSTPPSWGL